MEVIVLKGLPDAMRLRGARLYWEAFGGKLDRVLGPESRALTFFERVIRADHCIIALDGYGDLLGLVGFKTHQASFAGGTWGDLQAIYGRMGGLWRGMVLRALSREVDNDRFLLDGICVTGPARGQGVGTALLAAVCAEAVARGYPSVRLDVVDTNLRARKLYEREGFVATQSHRLGALKHVFGFAATITMVRPLKMPGR